MRTKKVAAKYPNVVVTANPGVSLLSLVARVGKAIQEASGSEEERLKFYDECISGYDRGDLVLDVVGKWVNLQP